MVPWFSKKTVDAPKVDDAPAMDDEAPPVAGTQWPVDNAAAEAETPAVIEQPAGPVATSPSTGPPPSSYERLSVRMQSTLRLLAVVLYWLAFMALNTFELQNDYRMMWRLRKVKWNRPVTRGVAGIKQERSFIWFTWAVHVAFVVGFAVFSCSLMVFRQVKALRSAEPQGRSGFRWLVWVCVMGAITTDWLKLYALGSVLNKLRYVGQWCPSSSATGDIKYALKAHSKASSPDCRPHAATDLLRYSIMFAMANLLFNTFIFFCKQPKGFVTKILSAIPSAVLTCMLYIKPLSSMMLLHYAQRRYINRGDMSVRSESIVALIAQVLALLFSLQMAYVISDLHLFSVAITRMFMACGLGAHHHDHARKQAADAAGAPTSAVGTHAPPRKQGMMGYFSKSPTAADDVALTVDQHADPHAAPLPPPPRVSLKATFKILVAQWFYTGQLPCAFGVLAPVLVVVSLRLWNFWIGVDLILGIAMFVMYLFLFFTHKLLFPQWQRT